MSESNPTSNNILKGFSNNTIITLGLAGLGGLAIYYQGQAEAKLTQANLLTFQHEMRSSASRTERAIEQSFSRMEKAIGEVQIEIRSIPSINARVNEMERNITKNDAHNVRQDTAIDDLREKAIANRTEIETLKRASHVALPGQPSNRAVR